MNKLIIKQRLTNKGFCESCKHEMPITSNYCPFCGLETQGYIIEECMEIKHLRNELNNKR